VARRIINVARISLTDLTINIARGARTVKVVKEWTAADIDAKWAASSWGAKLARQVAKAKMSDLDRFSAMLTRKAASKKVRAALGK
jgi:large subunit ribosomal protein L14e